MNSTANTAVPSFDSVEDSAAQGWQTILLLQAQVFTELARRTISRLQLLVRDDANLAITVLRPCYPKY